MRCRLPRVGFQVVQIVRDDLALSALAALRNALQSFSKP